MTSAIAAGGAEGGWNADQIASLAGAELGRGLSAENIRFLAFGKSVPLGVVVTGSVSELPEATSGAAPTPPAAPKTRRGRPGPHRRRGRAAAIGAAAVLTAAAVTAVTVAVAGHETPAPAGAPRPANTGARAGTGARPGTTAQAAAGSPAR